jgi:hypothetical protein
MNRIAAIALFAGAAVMTAAGAAAQSSVVEVNVPFGFTVNNTFLAAGNYTFGFDSMNPDLLVIRDQTRQVKAKDFGQRGSIGPGRPGSLIFHHYGSQYFLSEVHFDSPANGMFLPETKSEQRARKAGRQEDVSVAAARMGSSSLKGTRGQLRSTEASQSNETSALRQQPAPASDREEAFGATDRVRSAVMCGGYLSGVACSIFRAS